MIRVIYQCIKAVTIGNGAGRHAFQEQQTYSEKALQACHLTKGQKAAYFSRREIMTLPNNSK